MDGAVWAGRRRRVAMDGVIWVRQKWEEQKQMGGRECRPEMNGAPKVG